MGDAARQLPDRFHLLGRSELGFQPPPIGDVARSHDDRPNEGIVKVVDADTFKNPPAAVRMAEPCFGRERATRPLPRVGKFQPDGTHVVIMNQREQRSPDHLFGRPAEVPRRRRRRVRDVSIGVDEQERVGAVFDERAELRLVEHVGHGEKRSTPPENPGDTRPD